MYKKTYKNTYKKTTYKKEFERQLSKDAKYLIIVESPSKCQKIEGFLGSQYHCIASKGHIRTIDGLKSIDTKKNFETEYTIIEEKKSHIESMRKMISQFPKENIILAMDDDREGEGIAWHICQVFGLDIHTTKRILFREITKPALISAVSSPGNLNMPLVYAQQARQILDMIVGYKISPVLWKYLYSNKDNALSAGRCQTPALRLVYDMEMEESKKEMKLIYKTLGTFFSKNIVFELSKEFEKENELLEFLEETKDFEYHLSISEKKSKEKSPPKPFNTSNLLQTASNVLAMSPKETTSLCQQLYQEGHITYIRTDSMKYSGTFITEAKKFINETYTPEYLGEISLIENKDESNPHEAIRITHIEVETIVTENKRMQSLYKLIWRNTVESCMASYRYTSQKAVIGAPMKLEYSTEIEIPVFLGWKKVLEKDTETKEQNKGSGLLFYLETLKKSGKPFSYNKIDATVSVRGSEKHYTEASLIKRLEDLGIGRPSTFSSIVDTIQERGYVKKMDIEGEKRIINEYSLEGKEIQVQKTEKLFGKSKNKLVIQPVGILTIEFLVNHFQSIFSYEYTKDLEVELDEIASAKKSPWYETCRKCKDEIGSLVKNIKVEKPEYKIDENHVLVYEKYGAVIKVVKDKDEKGKKEKPEYRSVKKNIEIDLEKLKRGEYNLEDLLEKGNISLGNYQDTEVFLKNGRYGYYVEWGENKQSISSIKKRVEDIELNDIIKLLEGKGEGEGEGEGEIGGEGEGDGEREQTKDSKINILRELTQNLSIRKGKFGAYIFYKRPDMKKPEFFNIKKFKGSFTFAEKETLVHWINETYKINE